MQYVLDEAKALQSEIVENRRWLHRHPETGFDLHETAAFVRARLEEMGYEVSEVCECGLVALAGDPQDGPCILLRADMDALPIAEQTGLDFASDNGNMHACGHDTHTAMLLAAAKIVKNHESELKGCVKFLFQPDEEGCAPVDTTGGDEVLAGGVLENPTVDAVTALHIMTVDYPSGSIWTRCGTTFSSIDDIDIEVKGVAAHGSQPHRGVDPITIACHIHQGIQNIVAYGVDPAEQLVATFGSFQSGSAANIIPESAHMLGTLRSTSEDARRRFHERACQMVPAMAKAFGGEAEVRFLRGLPTVHNDPALTEELSGYAEELFGEKVNMLDAPISGSDDISVLSQEVPTTYFVLGSGTPDEGYSYPIHNPKTTFNESVFYRGAALLANAAIEYLEHRSSEGR